MCACIYEHMYICACMCACKCVVVCVHVCACVRAHGGQLRVFYHPSLCFETAFLIELGAHRSPRLAT